MFSVVIPVYNHSRYLREGVISALRSDLVKEILLCDDGSGDGSADHCAQLAMEFPNRVFDYSDNPSRNLGAHNRLNQLCRLSKQPWIRVLNSDDSFLPGSFETIRLLASTQRASFISGSMLICDETSQIKGTKRGLFDPEYPVPVRLEPKPLLVNQEVRRFLLNQNFIATTSNMAFTRNLFELIGGFRDYRYAHDLDFALRATIHGKAIHTAAYLVTYRSHSSNTISEASPHMDGEITRLYFSFLNDFPEVEEDPETLQFLKCNRHIDPFPSKLVTRLELRDTNKKSECKFSEGFPKHARPNALLALCSLNYNFVCVTGWLDEQKWPLESENIIGFVKTSTEINILIPDPETVPDLRGRLIRCLEVQILKNDGGADSLRLLRDFKPRLDGTDVHIGKTIALEEKICPTLRNQLRTELVSHVDDTLPVVYVMPIFLAVGGVERNAIEVIRLLQNKYRFVVITSESLSKSQGSLHWQLYDMNVPVFDLAEIAPQKHHLYLLSVLAQIIPPDLVWICNGSPWLVENSVNLRRLFANIPIIDQQVYDTKEGWINHYHKKGIQSFDRFIAINSKIKDVFQKRFMIPLHRVSQIYHLINEKNLRKVQTLMIEPNLKLETLKISNEYKRVFIWVGRLTEQKKPLSFLNLVRFAKESHPDCFFIMLGDGELSEKCNKYVSEYNLQNLKRITYHSCPPEIMLLSDGMIITSVYEGLPIAMLEALGVGIPVLATDVGDVRLVLEKYKSGHIFNELEIDKDIKKSLDCFSIFLKKLPHLKNSAMQAREKILTEFGSKKISSQYDNMFSEVLSQKH